MDGPDDAVLDLRDLQAGTLTQDDDLALIVSDTHTTVTISPGVGRAGALEALAGARRLQLAVGAYAEALARHLGVTPGPVSATPGWHPPGGPFR